MSLENAVLLRRVGKRMKANRAEEQTGALEIVQWKGSMPRRKVPVPEGHKYNVYIFYI